MKAWGYGKKILVVLLFVVAFLLGFMRISYVFREKEYTNVQDNFANLKKDSIDMVFVGTSHQFCSINTDLLYDEYGINSYMLATSAQTLPMSYYAAWEAIECQHPDTIVLEAVYCANDFRTVTPGMSHAFFDGMPWCKAKKAALDDLIPKEEQIYYYLNIGFFHTRWKELEEEDFKSNLVSARGNYMFSDVARNWDIPQVDNGDKEPMPEEMRKYLDKLIALCLDNEVELIVYVAPYNSLYDEDGIREDLFRMQRIFNWMGDYLGEQGVRYYNLFHELDAIGLKSDTDWKDSQHLNCNGQAKLTRYMVEKGYLSR